MSVGDCVSGSDVGFASSGVEKVEAKVNGNGSVKDSAGSCRGLVMGVPGEVHEVEAAADGWHIGAKDAPDEADDGAKTHLAERRGVGAAEVAGSLGGVRAKTGARAPSVGEGLEVGRSNAWGKTFRDEGVGVGNLMGEWGESIKSVGVVPFSEA